MQKEHNRRIELYNKKDTPYLSVLKFQLYILRSLPFEDRIKISKQISDLKNNINDIELNIEANKDGQRLLAYYENVYDLFITNKSHSFDKYIDIKDEDEYFYRIGLKTKKKRNCKEYYVEPIRQKHFYYRKENYLFSKLMKLFNFKALNRVDIVKKKLDQLNVPYTIKNIYMVNKNRDQVPAIYAHLNDLRISISEEKIYLIKCLFREIKDYKIGYNYILYNILKILDIDLYKCYQPLYNYRTLMTYRKLFNKFIMKSQYKHLFIDMLKNSQ